MFGIIRTISNNELQGPKMTNFELPDIKSVEDFLTEKRQEIEEQLCRPVTDEEFAGHLGIARSTYLAVMEGSTGYQPGSAVLTALMQAFEQEDPAKTAQVVLNTLRTRKPLRERRPLC
jgi:transcriptional regulator with XRE-family HTH domain